LKVLAQMEARPEVKELWLQGWIVRMGCEFWNLKYTPELRPDLTQEDRQREMKNAIEVIDIAANALELIVTIDKSRIFIGPPE